MKKLFLLCVLAICVSCSSDDVDYTAENEADIQAYIANSSLTFKKTSTGLYYAIDAVGSGVYPSFNSNVTVGYKGYFLNETIFDQSSEATFNVGGVVPGFSEALRMLKPGGNGTFILPSSLGYGTRGQGSIPPGSVIIFDINLISVN